MYSWKSSFIPHYIYAEIIQGSYDKYALTDIYLYILKDSTMGTIVRKTYWYRTIIKRTTLRNHNLFPSYVVEHHIMIYVYIEGDIIFNMWIMW